MSRRQVYLLSGAATVVAVFAGECAAFDITPGPYGALAIIRARPGIGRRGAARRARRLTIGGIVNRLAERGLINGHRPPPRS
jgi:hypothetical protein